MADINKISTKFFENNVDIGEKYLTKSTLLDIYPMIPGLLPFSPGLFSWGRNNVGQLGTNTRVDRSSPAQTVSGGINWKAISCGYQNAGTIKTDGTLWMWGNDLYGGLGLNSSSFYKSSPIQIYGGGTNWKIIACGHSHSGAIKTDGSLWLWGSNIYGELGTNDTVHRSSPVQTIAGGNVWKSIALGKTCSVAIQFDGSLWTWGRNTLGQLGTNDINHRSSPVQTVAGGNNWKTIAAGYYTCAGIKTDGTLWLWGSDAFGQLGQNYVESGKSSPVQTVAYGTNWRTVSCGYANTAAIKTDGTLWVWGSNLRGQLGDNTPFNKSSPIQTITGGTDWRFVSSGFYVTAGIKMNGTLWMWGENNNYGQLGINTTSVNKSSPVQTVAGGTTWKSVVCGYGSSYAIADLGDNF